MNHSYDELLPKLPSFSNELIEQCTQSRDFRPILFEWYKFVGIFCNIIASICPDSPALREISPVHYAVLIGLLNRCTRLMLSNIRLSSTRKYGETTSLLDRCISESAIKVQWLCLKNNDDSFVQYLADGLKKDLILKKQIVENISNRKGDVQVIEKRMLHSIDNCVGLSMLSEQKISDAKKLPDFAQMCKDLNYSDVFYTAIQRMGSHAIHGTWSDLIFNYISKENGQRFYLRDIGKSTQDVQYILIIHLVLVAMKSFINFITSKDSEIVEFITLIDNVDNKIIEIRNLAWASDFDIDKK